MHRLKEIMEKLEEAAKCEFDKGVQNVNTKEMSEVVDMIKDLTEAMYHYSIVEAMEEHEEWQDDRRYYRGQPRNSKGQYMRSGRRMYEPDYRMSPEMYRDMDKYDTMTGKEKRDMDKHMGRMYYTEPERMMDGMDHMRDKTSKYGEKHDKYMMGKRMYTSTEPMHKQKRMEMLDEYMNDLVDMAKETAEDMSPEEKQLWKTKINKLVNM